MFLKNIEYFKKLILEKKIFHSYLFNIKVDFFKVNFIYKLSKSLIFDDAKYLECENIDIKNELNNNIDFLLIEEDESKKILSEKFLDINDFVTSKPYLYKNKVILIKNIESMSENLQNKLLKLIEEPPNNLYILMISENTSNVIDTIFSRIIEIKLEDLSEKQILEYILKKDNKIDDYIIEISLYNIDFYYELINNKELYDKYHKFLTEFSRLLNKNYEYHVDINVLFFEEIDYMYLIYVMIQLLKDFIYIKNGGSLKNTKLLRLKKINEIFNNLINDIDFDDKLIYDKLLVLLNAQRFNLRQQNKELIFSYILHNI